jgi:hypothetical protein
VSCVPCRCVLVEVEEEGVAFISCGFNIVNVLRK